MGNFKYKLSRFMYGRYGQDQLYYAFIIMGFILIIFNMFIKSVVISVALWLILILATLRAFSKNLYRRRIENERFMKIWSPVKAKGLLTLRRISEIKTHRFRKCPSCKKVLRLPRRRGKHTVNCPCCHNDFKMHIWL
ncbi:hypothetical protein LY28_03158 [Ruminiclostridium sufflavum DSM 19573]|uniref:Zn-finger containing protein n=1 Tax=Ruminiclostridium sufflavum DSM 19573 TaxID=1121337 RepID=A0A318XH30_9FIRM|nr:hypothetical protein [Ruminiclostridium sufflavum]PYG85739.1 hypothetical protein LY28_03158 [Ruminiclostridium sufflavum DSM 19573]